jgi:hypothetical protein
MRTRFVLIVSLFALVGAPLAATGKGKQNRQSKELRTWQGTVPAGGTLYLRNVNGTVVTEAGAGDEVKLEAVATWKKGNPDDISVEIKEGKKGVAVCVMYKRATKQICDDRGRFQFNMSGAEDEAGDVEVELRVELPSGTRLEASSVNGRVTIAGDPAALRAETVNGGVSVEQAPAGAIVKTVNGSLTVARAAGAIEAETVNGGITIDVAGSTGTISCETLNGTIRLTLPAKAGADITAATDMGHITIDGEHFDESIIKKLGQGGLHIGATTQNGSIEIDRASR